MSENPKDWSEKRPRRGLKPWSSIEGGGIVVLHIDPRVRVAEEKRVRYCKLNETGGLIWQLCDGKHTVAEIVSEVVAQYGVEAGVANRDVHHLLEQMQSAGLVEVEGDSFF
ncbi:MAG TPA: PqqD family protein [Chloroflexi bacterium]|nr:PqqD family protein [Chloroflexota bacterium]